jgi:hypothetical protein
MTFSSKEDTMDVKKTALNAAKKEAEKIVVNKVTKGVIGDPHPPQRSLMDKLMDVRNKGVIALAAVAALVAAVAEFFGG